MLKFFREWRIVTLALLGFTSFLAWDTLQWFQGLADPSTGQGTFAAAVILAVVGVAKYWMETVAAKHD